MRATCQPALFDELARCRAWIEAALEYTNGTHTFDDIAAGVYVGRFSLFAGSESCAVLEINDYPRKRALNVFLVGGNLEEITAHMGDVEAQARACGASEITMTGRAGWALILAPQGWDKAHVSMRKTL